MLCSSLDGRGVQRRMDACICMTESLCCLPATIITLLISFTPIQDKKLRKSMATIENGFLRVPLWYSNRTHCREWREPIAVGHSFWYQPACFHKAVGGAVNDGCLQQRASAAPLSHPYSRALGLPGLCVTSHFWTYILPASSVQGSTWISAVLPLLCSLGRGETADGVRAEGWRIWQQTAGLLQGSRERQEAPFPLRTN